MTTTTASFVQYFLTGNDKSFDKLADSTKFLQGQLTINTNHITEQFIPTAICNLKGRVHFGLWIKRADDGFFVVLSTDLADDFEAHIKKYGTFSKIMLTDRQPIYPVINDNVPSFTLNTTDSNVYEWQKLSIATGNYWLTKDTSELFQPQELRLHQRGGVDFDKGCYLGQEIVARLYFRASPKAYLHRVAHADSNFFDNVAHDLHLAVVNSIAVADGCEALVVARPDDIENAIATALLKLLPLPDNLQVPIEQSHA